MGQLDQNSIQIKQLLQIRLVVYLRELILQEKSSGFKAQNIAHQLTELKFAALDQLEQLAQVNCEAMAILENEKFAELTQFINGQKVYFSTDLSNVLKLLNAALAKRL